MNYKKQLVYLRQRKRKNGSSFFLDYTRSDGSRVNETLGTAFFLTANNKQHHKEIRFRAEAIRQRKESEISQGEYEIPIKPKDILLSPLVKKAGTTRPNNINNYNAAADHLDEFQPGLTIQKTTAETLEKFRKFLRDKKLKENTIRTYLSKIRATLNEAVKHKLIHKNPAQGLKIGRNDVKIVFLTESEIQQLLRTPIKHDLIKKLFQFQLFTGLRFGDVKKLTYQNIRGDKLVITQSKTKGYIEIELNPGLKKIIGIEDGIIPLNKKETLFKLPSIEYINRKLKKWATSAGINKTLTTHVIRHTAATNILSRGISLTAVKDFLGHKDLHSTAVYLHAVDEEKKKSQKILSELAQL